MRARSWNVVAVAMLAIAAGVIASPTAAAGLVPLQTDGSVSGSAVEAPAIIVAVQVGSGVGLSWRASEGAVEYAVWRNGEWYDWVSAPVTYYTDTEPVAGARYQARAKNADGLWSRWTKAVQVSGLDGHLPAPGGVEADVTESGVELNWAEVPGAIEYAIWRNGEWYDWVSAPTTGYIDSAPMSRGRYQVRALGVDGQWSGWSSPVEVDTGSGGGEGVDNTPPLEVAGLRVIDKRPNDFMTFSWDPAIDDVGVEFYEIYIFTTIHGPDDLADARRFTAETTTLTVLDDPDGSFLGGGEVANVTYIRAVDAAGNRGPVVIGGTSFMYSNEEAGRVDFIPNAEDQWSPADGPAPEVTVTEGQIELRWSQIADNFAVSSTEVYRNGVLVDYASSSGDCAGPDCTFAFDGTHCNGTDCVDHWIDSDVVPGESYTYHMVAIDIGGNRSPAWDVTTVVAE